MSKGFTSSSISYVAFSMEELSLDSQTGLSVSSDMCSPWIATTGLSYSSDMSQTLWSHYDIHVCHMTTTDAYSARFIKGHLIYVYTYWL